MRILLLMTVCQVGEGNEDRCFSECGEFCNGACSRTAHDNVCERVEMFHFFVEPVALPVPRVRFLRVQFPLPREVEHIAEEDELFQILADGSIQCGCSLAPADHEEHGTFAGKSRHSPSAI